MKKHTIHISEQTSPPEVLNYRTIYLLTTVAALGGLLFGYDTAVISGAIGYLRIKFELSPAMTGWAASAAIIGCIFGAMFAGGLSDRFGRKKILILTAVLFGVSAIGSAIPSNITQFTIARFVGGLGVGGASILSPLYITEMAPASIRGKLVSVYQLAIVSGILLIFFVNMVVQNMGTEAWNINTGWRYMVGSEILPALLFFFAILFIPESPRWLMKENREKMAGDVLLMIHTPQRVEEIKAEIRASLQQQTGTLKELFTGKYRKTLIAGVLLAIFSQVQGINAIMYYAPVIFEELGTGKAYMQTVIIGVINLLFTFVAIRLVDRSGRRNLLLAGGAGMSLSLALIGASFRFSFEGYLLLFFILTYVACFAASYGPVTWVYISEIFPVKLRGLAISVATLALWAAVYLVTQFFPIMLESIGAAYTFWFYCVMSILALIFVRSSVIETKGRTLEEIERSGR
ncbi:MAG: sugar porter family MFS transporter [Bacteroidales bacterium]